MKARRKTSYENQEETKTIMTEEQLKEAARELVATCELLVAKLEDDPLAIFQYLSRLGVNDDGNAATPQEMWELERFWSAFREAWKQMEAKGGGFGKTSGEMRDREIEIFEGARFARFSGRPGHYLWPHPRRS